RPAGSAGAHAYGPGAGGATAGLAARDDPDPPHAGTEAPIDPSPARPDPADAAGDHPLAGVLARPQDVRGDPRPAGSRRAPPHHDAAGAAPLAAGDADALGADGRLGPGARLRCGRARVLRGWDVWGRSRWSVR